MNKITRKEAAEFVWEYKRLGLIDTYKLGYCCYQDDGISKYDMIELGVNCGVYGWNFTLYYSPENKTMYCNSYRNAPVVKF